MQIRVGTTKVRFLVENTGSMKPVYYVAVCRLHDLPHDHINIISFLQKLIPVLIYNSNYYSKIIF